MQRGELNSAQIFWHRQREKGIIRMFCRWSSKTATDNPIFTSEKMTFYCHMIIWLLCMVFCLCLFFDLNRMHHHFEHDTCLDFIIACSVRHHVTQHRKDNPTIEHRPIAVYRPRSCHGFSHASLTCFLYTSTRDIRSNIEVYLVFVLVCAMFHRF